MQKKPHRLCVTIVNCVEIETEVGLCAEAAYMGELYDRNWFEAGSSESSCETSHLEIPLETPASVNTHQWHLSTSGTCKRRLERLCVVGRVRRSRCCCGCILSTAEQEASHLLS